MKKICTVFLLLSLMVSICPVKISSLGAELGSVYYTDIDVYIKGSPITAYNIDDKLLVDCDSLSDYGFYVFWIENARQLSIIDSEGVASNDDAYWKNSNPASREIAGKYYESDIQVFLNGGRIPSYNMGDKVLICVDDMQNYDYNVKWNGEERAVSVSRNHKILVTDIGNVKTNFFEKEYWSETYSYKGAMSIDGFQLKVDNSNYLRTGIQNTAFVPLQDTLKTLGLWYEYNPISCEFNIYSPISPVSYQTIGPRADDLSYRVNEYYFTKVPIKILVDGEAFDILSGMHYIPYSGTTERVEVSPILYKGVVYVPANLFADILGYSCYDGINITTR